MCEVSETQSYFKLNFRFISYFFVVSRSTMRPMDRSRIQGISNPSMPQHINDSTSSTSSTLIRSALESVESVGAKILDSLSNAKERGLGDSINGAFDWARGRSGNDVYSQYTKQAPSPSVNSGAANYPSEWRKCVPTVTTSQPLPWLNGQNSRTNVAIQSSSFTNPMAQHVGGLGQTPSTIESKTTPDSDWEEKLIANACQSGGARIQPSQVREVDSLLTVIVQLSTFLERRVINIFNERLS